MKGLPVNFRAISRLNFKLISDGASVGSIITRYLHALQIEEQVHVVCPPTPHSVCCLVDVSRTKTCDPSQGSVLTTTDKQARYDSWMGCMFGIATLQLRIGGCPVTEDEMVTLAEHYPLTDSVMYMCEMGPAFQEPIDDDDSTADEEDGSDEDASDNIVPEDDDTDVGDGDGDAASMAVDFSTNMATR